MRLRRLQLPGPGLFRQLGRRLVDIVTAAAVVVVVRIQLVPFFEPHVCWFGRFDG